MGTQAITPCAKKANGRTEEYHNNRRIVLSIFHRACGEMWKAHASGIASKSNATGTIIDMVSSREKPRKRI